MAKYKIILEVEASRITTVEKLADKTFGGEYRMVRKVDPSRSRADRLQEIRDSVQDDAAQSIDELKDELQDWLDGLPENLQGGDKASELEDAIQALDEIKDSLEGLDFDSVSFPSMMG